MKTPDHLAHEDDRAQSILVLADSYDDETTLTTDQKDQIAALIAPNVPRQQAVDAFRGIAYDLSEAAYFDTHGEEGVVDRFGAFSHLEHISGDQYASELRDQHRLDARHNTEMLITLNDKLGAAHVR